MNKSQRNSSTFWKSAYSLSCRQLDERIHPHVYMVNNRCVKMTIGCFIGGSLPDYFLARQPAEAPRKLLVSAKK